MVLLFTYSCEKGHPGGVVRAVMITSGVVRLCGLPFSLAINLATLEDRHGAFTNALGTALVDRLHREEATQQQRDLEDGSQPTPNALAADQTYGATGTYGVEASAEEEAGEAATLEARVVRWRRHATRLRLPWEAGHGEDTDTPLANCGLFRVRGT
jgi:hypothetical protein